MLQAIQNFFTTPKKGTNIILEKEIIVREVPASRAELLDKRRELEELSKTMTKKFGVYDASVGKAFTQQLVFNFPTDEFRVGQSYKIEVHEFKNKPSSQEVCDLVTKDSLRVGAQGAYVIYKNAPEIFEELQGRVLLFPDSIEKMEVKDGDTAYVCIPLSSRGEDEWVFDGHLYQAPMIDDRYVVVVVKEFF